jgi:hypothetical protein
METYRGYRDTSSGVASGSASAMQAFSFVLLAMVWGLTNDHFPGALKSARNERSLLTGGVWSTSPVPVRVMVSVSSKVACGGTRWVPQRQLIRELASRSLALALATIDRAYRSRR